MENTYAQRIASLRRMMRERGWDAVVFTGSDPHSSEYPSDRWKQVRWLSGFTGECGDLVVTLDHAGLWTDTRYFIAAGQQLPGTGVELHKTRVPEQVLIPDWMAQTFAGQDEVIVAVDGLCVGAEYVQDIIEAVEATGADCLVASVPDLLDNFWQDRPEIPQTPIITVELGESRSRKLAWMRRLLESRECDGILLNALDDIAWQLNVRGADIEYNPMVISYLLITRNEVSWFVVKDAVEDEQTLRTFASLEDEGVRILPYSDVELELSSFDGRLMIDSSTLNYHMFKALKSVDTVNEPSPVQLRKAVKNPVEIQGMKDCHLLDGLAMERFLYWLEKSVDAQTCPTEWDAAVKLGELRAENPGYQMDSFETISAYGKGAALPHYVTPRDNAPVLYSEGLYLCDSGGQYLGGTTDITRTVALGTPTEQMKIDYTLVLKGHLALGHQLFPYGTRGAQLDALARQFLWNYEMHYGHGTGHGVGHFLNCHEGPQSIRLNEVPAILKPGMIVSNEPGVYRAGVHGVRIENLVTVAEYENNVNEFAHFLHFRTLTLFPYDKQSIYVEMLTPDELAQINSYHTYVFRELSPLLNQEETEWLRKKCAKM